ncbi:uncharacterized protein (DUF2236 family) [Microbacteriaceae bacterium SG_E_30_P1]|uniref:Uncharacterized protein (DUF2236 family) n=1 Tax=Antiquaquibacter oligotrophicus TaxID=2880260 RepID=A0ABT6KJ42_9MICO|nr:oxygenase MpaB family protein [Antiquaquibacter oligotrophicus]MDH6179988.1 uncharacterized protein (DUF2236 family) [Antiquaquibacter oligotrophicus]UDF14256.1 DUF2236 domain-containing protein [Antiquaquibacter oligotrophicus]
MALRITDVSDDAILLAGGAAAILLHVADPAIARGVAHHSTFAERPLDRLNGTLTYLAVLVYGTPDEARAVARTVGGAHRSVPGATDARLQLWVAATLYDTAMRVRALVWGEDTPANAETLLADFAVVGTALGVPASEWPASRAAFTEYWSTYGLEVGDDARSVCQALVHPVAAPWWMRAVMPTVRVVTAGLLPPELRDAYGLPHDQARFDRLVRRARRWYPRLPRRLRSWPTRFYLRRFRASRSARPSREG